MPINPLIPMGATPPRQFDLAGTIGGAANAVTAIEGMRQQRDMAPVRNALLNTELETAKRGQFDANQRSVIQGSAIVKEMLDRGDVAGAQSYLKTRMEDLTKYGVPSEDTARALQILQDDPTGQSLKSVVDANVALGIQSGILGGGQQQGYAPSSLGKLISERDMLPPGDERRAAYDRVIASQGAVQEGPQAQTPAAIQEFEYYQSLTPEQRAEWDRNKRGDRASTATEKEIFSAADGAQQAAIQYENYTDLATRYEQTPTLSSGRAGSIAEWLKEQTGTQDAASLLRKDWAAVKASEVVKNLPPGAASDADIAMALAGFLPNNANPKSVASFLRGVAKLAKINGEYQSFKADYLSQNKSPVGMLKAWKEQAKDLVPSGSTMSSGNMIEPGQTINIGGVQIKRVR